MTHRIQPPFAALLLAAVLAISPLIGQAAASREQAIAIALQQAGGDGKVLGVRETRDGTGRTVYEVKVLADGRVRVIHVPAD